MTKGKTRTQLEGEKHDLYDAIRALDRDRRDGSIDGAAYQGARRRYELEAAAILERLDRLDTTAPDPATAARATSNRRLMMVGTGVLVVLAIVILLGSAVRARTGTAAITGDVGQATPAPPSALSPQVLAAQARVRAHPGDADAVLELATAYINAKDNGSADAAYQRAIALAPHRPEPRTMYAMFKGSSGDSRIALVQLALVEHQHPNYAKAWLVDGLLSSRVPTGLTRAIRAWRRFLVLSPHVAIAPQVRALLANAERAQAHH